MRLLLASVVLVWPMFTEAGPLASRSPATMSAEQEERKDIFSDNLQGYLSQFGYLPKSNPLTGNLRQEKDIRDALLGLQRFAGLEPTGKLDSKTRQLLIKKRCGMPDIIPATNSTTRTKRYAPIKWDKEHLTYSVKSWTGSLGPGRVRREVFNAVQVWSGISSLTFEETANTAEADILIEFVKGDHGDGYAFDGPDVVLAHAFFPGPSLGGDVHFDDSEPWTDVPNPSLTNGVQLFAVTAHELGHSLGFGHSDRRDSLMFPYYHKKDSATYTLPYTDVIALQQVYGTGGNTVPESPPTTIPTTTSTTTTTSPVVTTTVTPPVAPNHCLATPDAIAKVRNELVVFKGKYFWRLDEEGYLLEQPLFFDRFWYGLPPNVTHIDAVYERPGKDKIVFFSAWFPKQLRDLGLPESLTHIDAIFVWGYNQRTYVFARNEYWRLDESEFRVEPDYPRPIDYNWKQVPPSISAAFTDHQDQTYFVKDGKVYLFDGWFMRVDRGWPKNISEFWAACRPPSQRIHDRRSISFVSASVSGLLVQPLLILLAFSLYLCI